MRKIGLQGSPLSAQQARLWALLKKSPAYRTLCAVRLQGVVKSDRLKMAVSCIVERHEILRTLFYTLSGMDVPVQIVCDDPLWSYMEISLEQLDAFNQEIKIDDLFTSLQRAPLDLQRGPLLHVWLCRLAADRYLLLVSLPALCADSYSPKLFMYELTRAYAREALTEEILQYADVAVWQEELLQEDEEEHEHHYWHQEELGHILNMRLPFEREVGDASQRVSDAFDPGTIEICLQDGLTQHIETLAQHYGVSLSAWLLASFQVLLWRLTDEATLVIGVACDGRIYEELTSALGPYVRFVPVYAHFEKDRSFKSVLTSVHASLQEAVKQQMYFTWERVDDLTRASVTAPFFPLSFEYDVWPAIFDMGEVVCTFCKQWSCGELFALKLHALQVGKSLQLELHYDPQRVSQPQASHLANLFHTLLLSVTEQPQAPVESLPLLKADEQNRLLTAFSAPAALLPAQGLHRLFEAQVKRVPDQLAVIGRDEQLSYQQLNSRANRLARVLRRRGVGPNVLVGLCMKRSTQMLVGLLGILKAGGAYVPLDTESPPARLAYQLEASQTVLLLTQREIGLRLSDWLGGILCLEDVEQEMAEAEAEDLPSKNIGEDIASVIYTSGSTGVPKGVMIRQASLINYALALCCLLGAEAGWSYATVSALSADLGNTAIFCALVSGGCVHVLDAETFSSTEAMVKWVRLHPIDVLKIVPSHLSALLTGEEARELLPRRALVLGGEALLPPLLERFRELAETSQIKCKVFNHYGPTETTVGVLVNPLGVLETTDEQRSKWEQVPLGKPIDNTQVYVLDRRMQLVPAGVTGEVYIGGAGLSIGYVRQAEQTAERFVPHPWSTRPGERLYRTGDLVRYGEQGQLEFVGRRDRQVKLRGYRIELAEIEAVFYQHPQIRECVVVLREDAPSNGSQLVSYVVTRQHIPLPTAEMYQFLRRSLPEYMVPAVCVRLDVLPLTANGKIDRQKLPMPEQKELDKDQREVGIPRSPIEEILVEMWKDLLGLPALSIHDHFFKVGGHSLLATQVIASVQAVLQVTLPVRVLFDAPTVAEFAQRVERARCLNEGSELPLLVRVARPAEVPLSLAQQRLWFLDRLVPGSAAYLAGRARRLSGNLNIQALEQSLQDLVCRHESLRTTFEQRTDQPVQVIHPAEHWTLPVIDLQALGQEKREEVTRWLAEQEVQHPMCLSTGPLLRTTLLRQDAEEHVLLLTLHHIITDGWSNQVLVREFISLYQANVSGQPSPLPPLPIQYADYAIFQRNWLQGEVLDAQLAYWRRQLANVPPLEFPADHPRVPLQTYRGASQSLQLPLVLSEGLIALSKKAHVTLFMLGLAAFQTLLLRYTWQTDISVGAPIANRTRAEIEGVVGFFVNILVLRTDLAGNPPFSELLKRVREVCLDAYVNADVPFEKLVEVLQPERDLSRSPLVQVSFHLEHALALSQQVPELRLEVPADDGALGDFELRMMVTQTQQELCCTAIYDTNLFEAQTICRLLEHFQTLLTGIVAQPEQPLGDLPLLSEGEQQKMLGEWNATQADYRHDRCVHQLFEEQVQRTPDAVALVFDGQTLTYAELNRRANQLAYYLQGGAPQGPEMLVGVLMQRCIEMVIALLAVLKAGGAYIPLDPAYPVERLVQIMAQCQISLGLTLSVQRALTNQEGMALCWLYLDAAGTDVWQESNKPVSSTVYADHLAYVISTSGSTGTPKGVAVSHRAIVNRLLWCQQTFPLTGKDRVLQMASICFDIAFWELFGPLIVGAQVLLAPEDAAQESRGLIQWFIEQAVTVAHAVPSLLRIWLQEPAFCQTQELRHFFCGGEAWWPGLAQRFQEQHHACLTQWYGPTEAAINVTSWTCPTSGASPEAMVPQVAPLGRLIANMQIYLLDKNMQPVPIGVAGEVYIGGVGLARGYFNQSELTAERFIPNPFGHIAGTGLTGHTVGTGLAPVLTGTRLYRTGDLARYWVDGSLEFLGRRDHQVKLRGHRIELGEIEMVLAQHSAVQEAVVIRREDELSGTHLVAYIVPDLQRAEAANQEALARLAEERLQYWQQLYEETYGQGPLLVDVDLNLVGWNSSYTGQPFPVEEMQAWLSDTVASVEMYHPKRLLEIGCGTGLLLFRLAPLVDHYYGTDFSAIALEGIRKLLSSGKKRGMQAAVTLLQKPADDFSGLSQASVDTVLINSVVQYFPDVNYLLCVLEGALRLVAPGGRIIVGDVRSLPLLEAFHASVQLYHAPETLTRQQLWQRMQRHLQQEEELVIAPAFFRHWAQTTGQVSRVEVRLKRGRLHNELTQFRYQVVMHIGEPVTAERVRKVRMTEEALNWVEQSMTLERLSEKLTKDQPKRLRLWQVPNARVGQAIQTLQWLKGESGPETVGQWRAELSCRDGISPSSGVEPEDLWDLTEQFGYRVTINWEHHGTDGSYTVLLEQREREPYGDAEEEVVRCSQQGEPVTDWHCYVNQPLRREVEHLWGQHIQQYLHKKLPDYMVPANVAVLSALPLLPNGKVDRRALAALEVVENEVPGKQETARTPMEELLLGLWCGVLGRTQLAVSDNFFDVGGHSLLATQLIARVRAMLGIEVPVRVLFEAPTVAELASRIEQMLRKSTGIEMVPLVKVTRPAEIPLSFAQQRLWFLEQLEPESTAYLIPEVLRLRGVLNTKALEASLREIVHRHEILRTTFVTNDGQPLQVIHPVGEAGGQDWPLSGPCPVLPVIDLQGLRQEERAGAVQLLAVQEAECPMRLAQGPLLRTYLLRLGMQEHMFLLTLHHIITDGWSTGVLVRELTTLYRTNVSGSESGQVSRPVPALSDLPIQYADYALWQRQWLQGEVLQKHIAYWQHQLEGASVLELPTDVPRTAVHNHGARYSFILPQELSAQLVSLSRQENVTLFMTLLSAFQTLLYRLTGQTDIVVGTDVANRTHVQTEDLIGFFVNLLVLRTRVQGSLSFRNMLKNVRGMVVGAYSHQELPFEVLVEQLGLERKEEQTPLLQVLFVLQNMPEIALSLPGIGLEVMESVKTQAKFDLALFLQEEPEGIRGAVVYRAALFKEQTIATWMRRLKIMLNDAVTRPDLLVDKLEIYTDEEKAEQKKDEEKRSTANREHLRNKKSKAIDVSELHSSLAKRGK